MDSDPGSAPTRTRCTHDGLGSQHQRGPHLAHQAAASGTIPPVRWPARRRDGLATLRKRLGARRDRRRCSRRVRAGGPCADPHRAGGAACGLGRVGASRELIQMPVHYLCHRSRKARALYVVGVSPEPRSWTGQRPLGERAATLAASYCRRRLGRAYAQSVWQMLADATRLGVLRHGRPEVWAGGAVVALGRASGLIGPQGSLSADEVAEEFDVTVGALGVIERELTRALHVARYAAPAGSARGA
jgi:Domain of unknown function (DUF6398)